MDKSTSMRSMASGFMISTTTSLYSTSWTPSSNGTYAATCIFLIVIASLLRALYAVRAILEQKWVDQALNRRYIVVAGEKPEAEKIMADEDRKSAVLVSPNGVEEKVVVVRRNARTVTPWRTRTDLARAGLFTVTTGVAYLLYVLLSLMI
jgi:hypothetical protein